MARRRSVSVADVDLPPTLGQLLNAAELECPLGHARALADLAALALRKVPSRGVFDPSIRGEHDLFVAIDAIARAHLDLGAAERAWRQGLHRAGLSIDARDRLERAAAQRQAVSDTAYFYTGLAFGLVFVCLSR
jgi:hypothetical protein